VWWHFRNKKPEVSNTQKHKGNLWDKYNVKREIRVLYGAPDHEMAAALLALVVQRTHGGEVKVRLDQNGEESTYLLDRNAIARLLTESGLRITFCRNAEDVFCPEDECMLEEAREIHVKQIFDSLNWYIILAPV
jgi:hypothetical protein